MEMYATSPGPENQDGMDFEKVELKDGESPQPRAGEQRRAAKKSCRERARDAKRFFWNPETRECMGRTSQSWGRWESHLGQILLFYLVFYSFLAGMFTVCLYVLLLTVSPFTPTYRDRVSPPGAMIRPEVKDSKLSFNISDQNSWSPYVKGLDQYLQAYNDEHQEAANLNCTPGQYFHQETIESAPKFACQFKRSSLKNCSGLDDPSYGYSVGEPCILLKMNRIIGYEPGYGSPVTVSCKLYVNYTSPLVAIQFKKVKLDHPIVIQCQLNGVGIINDYHTDRFLGRIVVRLHVGP
ncbi:hypothetical protein lerEdw1_014495 [Lerista edwardsae]|nr:hypothetical protein lerEdw1_014499 [Lerista edwardsae]KAJ6633519.1 hypothetical protein lerEdw1_014495 [Lerista edwardsae]